MLTLAALLLTVPAAQAADPLAPAKRGEIQCIRPNKEKKTCFGTGTYTVRKDGTYDAVMTIVVAPQPLITIETKSSGKVEGQKVCGLVRKADFEAATMKADGNPLDEASANMIRTQLLAAIAPMEGKNSCWAERTEGDVTTLDVTLDGAPQPAQSQPAIWVKPSDGYTLGM